MIKGRVKWFDTGRGYGFVISDDIDGDILLHANVLRNFGRGSIAEGAEITFEVQDTDRGQQIARILDISTPALAGEGVEGPQAELPDVSGAPLLPARVKWFDKVKGFGFVNIFGHTDDIFLHMEVLRQFGFADLGPGEAVAIQAAPGPRGQVVGAIYPWDHAVRQAGGAAVTGSGA